MSVADNWFEKDIENYTSDVEAIKKAIAIEHNEQWTDKTCHLKPRNDLSEWKDYGGTGNVSIIPNERLIKKQTGTKLKKANKPAQSVNYNNLVSKTEDWSVLDLDMENEDVLEVETIIATHKKPRKKKIKNRWYAEFYDDFVLEAKPPKSVTSKFKNESNHVKKYQNPNSMVTEGYIKTIPFQILKTISEREPVEMFLEISKQFFEFFETVSAEPNTPDRVLETLIDILAKICQLPLHETRKYILIKSWRKVSFWKHLANYVKRLSQHEKKLSAQKVISLSNLTYVMSNILVYCTFFIRNLHYEQSFVEFLKRLSYNYSTGNENPSATKIGNKFECLILEANNNLDQQFCNEIYPTLDDLKGVQNHRMHHKLNMEETGYSDVRRYIEIQLALLKEDFISPLRNCIKELISHSWRQTPNLKIYNHVKFNVVRHAKYRKYENILIDLNLSSNKLKAQDLINSNKCWVGSLVCLTTNCKFEDLILGVITNRDSEILSKGLIQIDIIKTYNHFGDIFSQTFLMLESEIFFEPYHQVYNVLKNIDNHNFPLKKYIIDGDTKSELPDYIPNEDKVYYTYRKKKFDIKDPATMPTASFMGFDDSQYAAFQGALTRNFCTIQGPPGTGKTFLGLKIMTTLLENTQLQILVICLTNHALDQFLTGTLNITNNIVRMGLQSKKPHLDQFNIKNVHEHLELDKRIQISYYNTRQEYNESLAQFKTLQQELGNSDITDERKQKISDEILLLQDKMSSVTKRLQDLNQIRDYNLIKDKRVVFMTTTYAARCRSLLKMLRTPIVLIVETGEVLKAHIIATLTEDTQHVIMIGDHHQLRPIISVCQLGLKNKKANTLYDRMINNGINYLTLKTQHRQRPEFANLIRPILDHELYDSESVRKFRNVKGVDRNLFFINHTNKESRNKDETTVRNWFETEFLMEFCNYLLQQGYQPCDITILTPYNGQMRDLLSARNINKNLARVRVSVVDGFLGEESKIVILSLVRNNSDGVIGNLGIKNRISIGLSRAREGFYIIGNMELLSGASSTWKQIKEELIKQNAINNYIPLKCSTHRGNIIKVSQPCEFSQLMDRGCRGLCTEINVDKMNRNADPNSTNDSVRTDVIVSRRQKARNNKLKRKTYKNLFNRINNE